MIQQIQEHPPQRQVQQKYSINVTARSSDYTLSGTDRSGSVSGNDPSVTINAGDTINFAAISRVTIYKTVQGTGTDNLASGVSGMEVNLVRYHLHQQVQEPLLSMFFT